MTTGTGPASAPTPRTGNRWARTWRTRRTCERRLQGQDSGNETRQGEHRRTTDACNDSCRVAVVGGRGQQRHRRQGRRAAEEPPRPRHRRQRRQGRREAEEPGGDQGQRRHRRRGRRATEVPPRPRTPATARDQLAETKDSSDTGDKAGKQQRRHLDQGHRRQGRQAAEEPPRPRTLATPATRAARGGRARKRTSTAPRWHCT